MTVWDSSYGSEHFAQGPPARSSGAGAIGGASAISGMIQGLASLYVGRQQRKMNQEVNEILTEANNRMFERRLATRTAEAVNWNLRPDLRVQSSLELRELLRRPRVSMLIQVRREICKKIRKL